MRLPLIRLFQFGKNPRSALSVTVRPLSCDYIIPYTQRECNMYFAQSLMFFRENYCI
nr:MAG TPA: hypothetical protein [Caudoviricetes sp.]